MFRLKTGEECNFFSKFGFFCHLLILLYRLGHWSHWKGRSVAWVLAKCPFRLPFDWNFHPHCSHTWSNLSAHISFRMNLCWLIRKIMKKMSSHQYVTACDCECFPWFWSSCYKYRKWSFLQDQPSFLWIHALYSVHKNFPCLQIAGRIFHMYI